jgi:hypothetical protein
MPFLSMQVRAARFVMICAAAVVPGGAPADSQDTRRGHQEIVVAGKIYVSTAAFLAGSWTWKRDDPPADMQISFSAEGTFSWRDNRSGLTANGVFTARETQIELQVTQTCNSDGCNKVSSPAKKTYPLRLVGANEYRSADEVWLRSPGN